MKITKLLALSAMLFSLTACGGSGQGQLPSGMEIVDYTETKPTDDGQFDFEGNFTPPELTIDGLKTEVEWQTASELITFGSTNQATVQIYRGTEALFCFFNVLDPDIQTVGNNNGDDVTHGDSVEIYFDFKNDGSSRPASDDIQINIGAHGKTRIFVGSNGEWGSWNGLLDYEVKLYGTLNDKSDVDIGYDIELMIPYSQVGIDQNSVFGVALGHVARGTDSTNPDLDYTWGGLTFMGSFVDPQVPASYMVFMGNNFYSRSNLPIGNIEVNGKILNQKGEPVEGATIKVGGNTYTSGANGNYIIGSILADNGLEFEVSKDGYKTYTRSYTVNELKSESGRKTINFVIIETNSTTTVTLTGIIKNPAEGIIKDAKVTIGNAVTYSDSNGKFSITAPIDNDLEIIVSKELYKDSITTLDILTIVGNPTIDIGTVSLYSPSSFAEFGGSRGIPKVTAEIFRGFDGINFVFTSNTSIVRGDHVELFIDSGTSFSGRDTSDYRIDFNGEGNISIVNFGNGNNTIVSTSGIKNNAYLQGETYYMETLVPYSFLGVEPTDIIGISLGVWSQSLSDWDGWNYAGPGFADYVAPEYTDQYCRIGLDNGLYRASSNKVQVTKVYGTVTDVDGNPILNATVNGHLVNELGGYSLYFSNDEDVTLTVAASGFVTQEVTIPANNVTGSAIKQDFTLAKAEAVITGTINVDGVKIYLEADPTLVTYSENGTYTITVPTTKNARIVFEKEGYKTKTKAFSVVALAASANENTPITYNCEMELE